MESRQRTFDFLASRPDLFPRGPYKYRLEDYNYKDDGSDYRPSHPLYLAAKDSHTKKNNRSTVSTVLLGFGAIGVMASIGLALSGESKRNEWRASLNNHSSSLLSLQLA